MSTIRVLLVDDHIILRQGLRALLEREEDIQVVGDVGDGIQALLMIPQKLPDVVVMDSQLPGLSGAQTTAEIRQTFPNVQVLALTMFDDRQHVMAMIQAGARGYLLKTSDGHGLAEAIRKVHTKQTVLDPGVVRIVIDELRQGSTSARRPNSHLTKREDEILRFIVAGKSSREIADTLGISSKTVDNLRAHVLQKLGARNTAEAIVIALQTGLVSDVSSIDIQNRPKAAEAD